MQLPADALVLLIGAPASGKSTFARNHFAEDTIISSDTLRSSRAAGTTGNWPKDVFAPMHALVEKRLAAGLLTVIDATNTDWMRRSELIRTAREHGRAAVAIVFNLPLELCLAQNGNRSNAVPASVIRRQVADLERDLDRLDLEGFSSVYILRSTEDVAHATVAVEGPGQDQ